MDKNDWGTPGASNSISLFLLEPVNSKMRDNLAGCNKKKVSEFRIIEI